MELALPILLFLLGVVLVVKGGDWFVDAATWIAEISGIPKLIIGATVVSVATTLPELLVSTLAALQGKVDMAIGNAVGSVTANIGLIMAISVLFIPSVIKRKDYLSKSLLMLAASFVLLIGALYGEIGLPFILILLVLLALFVAENLRAAKNGSEETENEKRAFTKKEIPVNVLKFVVGAAGIVGGAQLLVDSGSDLALMMGVSERIVGVTMVAVGTSLPELVTTITAIAKKQSSLSVGNILGANILDLTMILPISAIASGKALPVVGASAYLDLPVCLLVGGIAVVPALICSKFRRWQGVVLLAVYAGYVALTCMQ